MNLQKWALVGVMFSSCLIIYIGCNRSPFSDAGIQPEAVEITGQVEVQEYTNENVYVWLEGFEIDTRTNTKGEFRITIPKEMRSASYSAMSGIYRLYFYIANYRLVTQDIIVQNGKFVYGRGALDSNGQLNRTVNLFKILDINTIVAPTAALAGYRGPIDVQVTLRATLDSVSVVYPKSIGGLLGGILLRENTTEEVFVDIPDIGAATFDLDIITTDPRSRRMIFQMDGANFRDLFLPAGKYTVIPYFLILHENLPDELLRTMGQNVEQLGAEFLKIPYRRDGGNFQVVGEPES